MTAAMLPPKLCPVNANEYIGYWDAANMATSAIASSRSRAATTLPRCARLVLPLPLSCKQHKHTSAVVHAFA